MFPKWRQTVNLYKQFDKFNNKKVSDVFRDTKGKRIGNRLIGDFGGFDLLQDISKLLNNEGGFQLRDSLPDILKDIEYKSGRKRGKKIVQGEKTNSIINQNNNKNLWVLLDKYKKETNHSKFSKNTRL